MVPLAISPSVAGIQRVFRKALDRHDSTISRNSHTDVCYSMQPAAAPCQELDILKARYHADLKVYSQAIRQLDLCKPEDFKLVWEDAERARVAFENASAALNSHIAEHGCG